MLTKNKKYIYHAELILGNQRIIMGDNVDIELPVVRIKKAATFYGDGFNDIEA